MNRYYMYDYPMPLAAATMCYKVQRAWGVYVLLVKRNEDEDTYPGRWCFPGGFLEVNQETLEECASREMKEETGLLVHPHSWRLLMVQSGPNDDPRGHMINTVYITTNSELPEVEAADDVCEYRWVDINKIKEEDLAFKHNDIAEKLWIETYY